MDVIKRPKEQIKKLISSLTKELNTLPDYNAFGGSNAEDKEEIKKWIVELEMALEGELPEDKDGEIYWWLTGKSNQIWIDMGLNEG